MKRCSTSLITDSESESCSVVSDSLWPHRLFSSWNSPAQNTRVGSLSLLQEIFATQGSNPGLLHCRRILYHLSHKGSPRILEWAAYPFSSGSSRPRGWTRISCTAGEFFTSWALREAVKHRTMSKSGNKYPQMLLAQIVSLFHYGPLPGSGSSAPESGHWEIPHPSGRCPSCPVILSSFLAGQEWLAKSFLAHLALSQPQPWKSFPWGTLVPCVGEWI